MTTIDPSHAWDILISFRPTEDFWPKAGFLVMLLAPWFVLVGRGADERASRLRGAIRWMGAGYLYTRLMVDFVLWGPIVAVLVTAIGAIRPADRVDRSRRQHVILVWAALGVLAVVAARAWPYQAPVRWLICTMLCVGVLDPLLALPSGLSAIRPRAVLDAIAGLALGLASDGLSLSRFVALVAMGVAGGVGAAFVMWRERRKDGRWTWPGRLGYGLVWTVVSVLAACFALEIYFRHVYDATDANAGLHTARLWRERHLHLNSWGFRDPEYEPLSRFDDHLRIAVLGDSFAFGRGITDADKLFGPRLERAIATTSDQDRPVVVFNLSRDGWTTLDELSVWEAAKGELRPHVVVLVYMLNDITDSVPFEAARHPALYKWEPLRKSSVALDFLIWHIYIGWPGGLEEYVPREVHYYQNDTIWARHAAGIEEMIASVREAEARMVVALYPYLITPARIGAQREALDRLAEFFESRDVPVVDVSLIADTTDPRYVVSPFDAHPDAELTGIVAKAVARSIAERRADRNGTSRP